MELKTGLTIIVSAQRSDFESSMMKQKDYLYDAAQSLSISLMDESEKYLLWSDFTIILDLGMNLMLP